MGGHGGAELGSRLRRGRMPDDARITGLLSAAEQVAVVADDLGRTFARELQRVQIDLERELRRLLVEAQAGSRTATALAARGLQLRRQLREVLEAAGYDDLATTATSGALERMAKAIERMNVAAQVATFTSRDATRIAALKELARLDLLAVGDEVSIALWRSTVQGLFSQRSPNAILDDLAEVLDKEMYQVRNLYDTTVSIYGRQVEALKKQPDDLFVYAGPVDSRMRAFCRKHVGKVYAWDEFAALENGQLPNPAMTGGGFQCRHQLVAISKFSELRELHGTGERVPEISEQLRGVTVSAKAA
jgi:hypothetical protein